LRSPCFFPWQHLPYWHPADVQQSFAELQTVKWYKMQIQKKRII